MCTLYVLVRNLDADGELQFRDFRIREIRQGYRAALDKVRQLLRTEDVNYGDWLIEREYAAVPAPAGQNPAGVGRIPLDAKDKPKRCRPALPPLRTPQESVACRGNNPEIDHAARRATTLWTRSKVHLKHARVPVRASTEGARPTPQPSLLE